MELWQPGLGGRADKKGWTMTPGMRLADADWAWVLRGIVVDGDEFLLWLCGDWRETEVGDPGGNIRLWGAVTWDPIIPRRIVTKLPASPIVRSPGSVEMAHITLLIFELIFISGLVYRILVHHRSWKLNASSVMLRTLSRLLIPIERDFLTAGGWFDIWPIFKKICISHWPIIRRFYSDFIVTVLCRNTQKHAVILGWVYAFQQYPRYCINTIFFVGTEV